MDDFHSLETYRMPINMINNNTLLDEEHVCKLVLYMEIPNVK